jgi:hypothetical protein
MSKEVDDDRRRLLRTAAVTVAAAGLGVAGPAKAQSSGERSLDPPSKPATTTSFGSLKQIDAGVLNVGYVEAGPPPTALWSCCFTAGPTTFTAMSMWRPC